MNDIQATNPKGPLTPSTSTSATRGMRIHTKCVYVRQWTQMRSKSSMVQFWAHLCPSTDVDALGVNGP